MPFNPEDKAEAKLTEIEGECGPDVCSLEEYRSYLKELGDLIHNRVAQLNEEIG